MAASQTQVCAFFDQIFEHVIITESYAGMLKSNSVFFYLFSFFKHDYVTIVTDDEHIIWLEAG